MVWKRVAIITVSAIIGLMLGIVATSFYMHMTGVEKYDAKTYMMPPVLIFSSIFLILGCGIGIKLVQKRGIDQAENISNLAVASISAAIVSSLFFWITILAQTVAVGAIVCGIIALAKIRDEPPLGGRELAIFGIFFAALHLITFILIMVLEGTI